MSTLTFSEDDPVFISDSDLDRQQGARKIRLKKSGAEAKCSSYRSEARKAVDYNTERHPQDKDIDRGAGSAAKASTSV